MGLIATGVLTKVEAKPWKSDPEKSTTYVYVTEHGYSQKLELSSSLDESIARSMIGRALTGAVRVFTKFDEKVNRVNTRVVLMSIDPTPVAAAA